MSLPSAKKRKIFDGRYEVLSIVGRGLDSVVYHAKHLSGEQQEVALKVLVNNKPKSSITERLRKEALTLVSCRHKYVVRLDDFHSVAELCYLSMEYARLGDLRKYVSSLGGGALPADVGAEFLRQSLEAIEFIHATGVLHRDLKPDNILVINDKEIRLADFGLALLPGDELDLEELQNGVGSLSYLPPEMLEGQFYDSRSDLYSLGVCFYEVLAGFHPFDQAPLIEQKEVRLDKNIKPLHEVNPRVPRHVSEVIATLMRYSADARFQTAMQALRALSDSTYVGGTSTAVSDQTQNEVASESYAFHDDPGAPVETLEPANTDDVEDSFTDAFEDFFSDPSLGTTPTPLTAEPANNDTEEMSAQRVQQLIDQDSKTKAAALARKETSFVAQPSETSSLPAPTKRSEEPAAPLRDDSRKEKQLAASPKVGLITKLLSLRPIARTLVVGCGAALVTVTLVLLSHLKPTQLISSAGMSINASQGTSDEEPPENPAVSLAALPAGTYAGSIEGLLPGTTSPLALIASPEQNSLTVVIGIEGWTPTTVSTQVEEADTHSPVVIRSNSVILNLSGEVSGTEVTGTFTNPITGEAGVWSARKISQ